MILDFLKKGGGFLDSGPAKEGASVGTGEEYLFPAPGQTDIEESTFLFLR